MLLGGRTAEELIFADPTTGAQNDIDRATTIARQMVTEYGMSDSLGPMRFGHPQGEVFLGRDFTSTPDYSDVVAAKHRRRGAHVSSTAPTPRPCRCSSTIARFSIGCAARAHRPRDARGRAGPGALRRGAHVGRRRRRRRARERPSRECAGGTQSQPGRRGVAVRPDPASRRLRVTDTTRCIRCPIRTR